MDRRQHLFRWASSSRCLATFLIAEQVAQARQITLSGPVQMRDMSLMISPELATPSELGKLLYCTVSADGKTLTRTSDDRKRLDRDSAVYRTKWIEAAMHQKQFLQYCGPSDIQSLLTDIKTDQDQLQTLQATKPPDYAAISQARFPAMDTPTTFFTAQLSNSISPGGFAEMVPGSVASYSTLPIGEEASYPPALQFSPASFVAEEREWISNHDGMPPTQVGLTGGGTAQRQVTYAPAKVKVISTAVTDVFPRWNTIQITTHLYNSTGEIIDDGEASLAKPVEKLNIPNEIKDKFFVVPLDKVEWQFLATKIETDAVNALELQNRGHLAQVTASDFRSGSSENPIEQGLGGGIRAIGQALHVRGYECLLSDSDLSDLAFLMSSDRTINLEELWKRICIHSNISVKNGILTITPKDEKEAEDHVVPRSALDLLSQVAHPDGSINSDKLQDAMRMLTVSGMNSALWQMALKASLAHAMQWDGRLGLNTIGINQMPGLLLLSKLQQDAQLDATHADRLFSFPTNDVQNQVLVVSDILGNNPIDEIVHNKSLEPAEFLPSGQINALKGYFTEGVTTKYYLQLNQNTIVEIPSDSTSTESMNRFTNLLGQAQNNSNAIKILKAVITSETGELMGANGAVISQQGFFCKVAPVIQTYSQLPPSVKAVLDQTGLKFN